MAVDIGVGAELAGGEVSASRAGALSRGCAVGPGVGAGCLVGMQAPINSRLGRTVGSLQAATFSFLVGTVALVLLASRLAAAASAASATSGGCPGGRSSAGCSAPST